MRSPLLLFIVAAVFAASTSQHPSPSAPSATILCGNVKSSSRVKRDRIPAIDDFPWTALLFFGDGDFSVPKCGGVLISESVIVTAARCVIGDMKNGNLTFVRLGEYDLNRNPEYITYENGKEKFYETQVDIQPKRIFIHPEYESNTTNQHHDIALIQLEQPVNYSSYIQPICLPDQPFEISAERNFTAAGWGLTDYFRVQGLANTVTPIKLTHDLQLFDRQACQEVYSSQISLGSDQLCVAVAGEPTKDTCSGFLGSPLMVLMETQEHSYWMLVGLVGHELQKCDFEGKPAIYTNMKQYVVWIRDNMEDLTRD